MVCTLKEEKLKSETSNRLFCPQDTLV